MYANERGYLRITRGPQRGRYIHHLVLEAKLGRPLLPDEQAHHINGDKQDNSWENLEAVHEDKHVGPGNAKPWHRKGR